MIEEFLNKYRNNQYISNKLYQSIKLTNPNIIINNFNLDTYNSNVLDKEYNKYKDYFEHIFDEVDSNIKLDEEQIKSIIADEDYSLILAGAGTGKTTTMVGKVKYLVDIKKVDPSKILVVSYTKKATEELERRIVIDFQIPVSIATFHSLGYKIIRNLYKDRRPYIVDENTRNQIFREYFKELFKDKTKIDDLIELFTSDDINEKYVFTHHFLENYRKYLTWEEYFKEYKKYKMEEAIKRPEGLETTVDIIIDKRINAEHIITINGELVKSKGEAIIANFLYKNGIEYQYEKVYDQILPDYKTYRPDFTLNLGGENIYLEYFGLSNYKDSEFNTYNKIRKIKEDYHNKMHNKFIAVDYHRNENMLNELSDKLKEMGFIFKPKSTVEIFDRMMSCNEMSSLNNLMDFFYDNIDTVKASLSRETINEVVNNYIDSLEDKTRAQRQYNFFKQFLNYYQKCLFGGTEYGFDYSDLIYYSKKNLSLLSDSTLDYQYIIIDEYQDISFDRYELTNKLVNKNNSKIVAVGDDWQTIFSFAGSKIEYIYNFQKYYKSAKIFSINKTYRNSQKLVDYAGKFIMQNNNQISKNLISDKNIDRPIRIIEYDDTQENQEIEKLKLLIKNIHEKKPNDNILILSRYNKTINNLFHDDFFKDDINTKIKIKDISDIEVNGMSIHKSKGLTADEVIVIGLTKNFPSYDRSDFWIKELFKNKQSRENIEFAEERRVFYVALTRTKNYVFLLTPHNLNNRSSFVNEMIEEINN